MNQLQIKHFELPYQQYQQNSKQLTNMKFDKYIVYQKINLDHGAFGKVYKAMNVQTNKIVAVKLIDLLQIQKNTKNPKILAIKKRLTRTQSEMMSKVNSPHVMKLYDVYQNQYFKVMVVQYCNGGNLNKMIYDRGRIPQKKAIQILKQLVVGIAAMHQQSIVHRDLKSQNIMSNNNIFKIIDLGFAKKLPNNTEAFKGTLLGTKITMAPQVILSKKYGVKADIWSLGVIFYEMIYGILPYQPLTSLDMYKQIISKNIFPNNGKVNGYRPSPQIIRLLKKFLQVEQKDRISWSQLLDHQIFDNVSELSQVFSIDVSVRDLDRSPSIDTIENQDLQDKQYEQQKHQYIKKSVKVQKISNRKQINTLLKQLISQQHLIMNQARIYYLQCLKTQYILTQIIIPIQQTKFLDLSHRKSLQLMYLLSSRCFCNMSLVNFSIRQQKIQILQILVASVKHLYQKVLTKFNQYCNLLNNLQDKLGAIITDRIQKIFKGKQKAEKQRFLVGLEDPINNHNAHLDYTKQQQIMFTYHQYIQPLILSKQKPAMLINKLKKYNKINMIQLQQLQHKSFNEYVHQILLQQ